MIGRDGSQGVLPFATLAVDESRVVRSGDNMTMWPSAPLESVAQIVSGVTKGRRIAEPVQEVPYLRVANVQAGHLALSDIRTIPASPDEVERFRLRKGDVLMTEGGDPDKLGRGALWSGAIDPCIHQNHIFRVRLDPNAVVPEYFVRLLSSAYGKQYFLRAAKQTTGIASINKTQLSAFPVPLPPLPEQRRIADILDKADAIRRKRKKAIALTEELLRSTFLDMFGDPVTNPKAWPVKSLDELGSEFSYGTSTKCSDEVAGHAVLRIPNVVGGFINTDDMKYADLDANEAARFTLQTGDLLFVRSNGNPHYIGRSAVFSGAVPMLFASYLIRARLPKRCPVSPLFVHTVFSADSFRERLLKEATTTAGNYNINTKGLGRQRMPLPPLDLQTRFTSAVARTHVVRERQIALARDAGTLFASVVQRAFLGQLSGAKGSC